MRIVLDTNVLISGAFFGGPPSLIVDACIEGTVQLVVSPEIWAEYVRVGSEFTRKRPTVLFDQLLALLAIRCHLVRPDPVESPVCRDPNDDMFVACALAAESSTIISGDRGLLAVSSIAGVTVLTPREFVSRYLTKGA